MENAKTYEIEVDNKKLVVYVNTTNEQRAVEGIWLKGGRDPKQVFNALCDTVPWCHDPGDVISSENMAEREAFRDEVIQKIHNLLGADIIFPIKPNARKW